jgi:MFS family permease
MIKSKDSVKFDFNRILISRFISGIGDWGGLIAISNLSYNSTHSVKSLSIIYAAKICSILFSSVIQNLLLSKIKQTFSIGKILGILEFISALSLISILKVDGLETSTLAALYFLSAICSSIFLSLTNTLITEMYPTEYKAHFRIVQFSKRAAFLIGPVVMGAIIGVFGNRIGIIADAVSFFLSGFALYSISAPMGRLIKSEVSESPESNTNFNFQKPKVLLFLASSIVTLVGIAGGAVNSIELPYIVTQLNLGSSFFGLSLALGGLGAFIGLLIDKQIPNDYSSSQLIFLSILGLIVSFIPWYFQSTYLFALALVLFGISITVFSNRTLFYLVDCYNGSSEVKDLFKDKPTLFLFYHQVDSVAMIIGAIISGIIADLFSTRESVHLIMLCLIISIFTNLFFIRLSTHREVK